MGITKDESTLYPELPGDGIGEVDNLDDEDEDDEDVPKRKEDDTAGDEGVDDGYSSRPLR